MNSTKAVKEIVKIKLQKHSYCSVLGYAKSLGEPTAKWKSWKMEHDYKLSTKMCPLVLRDLLIRDHRMRFYYVPKIGLSVRF